VVGLFDGLENVRVFTENFASSEHLEDICLRLHQTYPGIAFG
jgi:hypothetical protein